ncbi:MAG: tetratricopeptide repeat protein [Nitrospirota bacterium]|nr:tetratricopeptide repeat protein [Nitrospirota bacterium]
MIDNSAEKEQDKEYGQTGHISASSGAYRFFNRPFLHVVIIAAISFLIYSNTFHVPFEFDDLRNITDNLSIKDVGNSWPPSGTRWVGFLSFALNYYLGGLEPVGYNIGNLAVHIVTVWLVYSLILLIFRAPYFSRGGAAIENEQTPEHIPFQTFRSPRFFALTVALLFASHPIQTQAVTYIVQRFASLATLFYLLALVSYIKFRLSVQQNTEKSKKNAGSYFLYSIALLSAVLSMKTKEIAFTLPAIIIVCELYFFEWHIKKRIIHLIPFILAMLIIPSMLLDKAGHLTEIRAIDEIAEKIAETPHITRSDYLITQSRVIVTYIRLLVLPVNQNLDYDYPIYKSFFSPEVVISFLFLLSLLILGIYLYHLSRDVENKNRYWYRLSAFGIFWFFLALSVESSVIPINDVIFEHRVYLPSVGFFIVLASAIELLGMIVKRKTLYARAVIYLIAFVIFILSVSTVARNSVWKDNVTLWSDVTKKSPDKSRPHYNLGNAYRDKGRFNEAITEYLAALKIRPDHLLAHNNLGVVYAELGRFNEAISQYLIALIIKPDDADAHNNLGSAYAELGRFDEAINQYLIALKIKPTDKNARQNLEYLLRNR